MKLPNKVAAAVVAGVLGVTPAIALAHGNPHNPHPGKGKPTTTTTATTTTSTGTTTTPYSFPGAGKHYGVLCRDESKKHVAGQKGTPFSNCVVALAQAAKHPKSNPAKLCATESKKHVKGQKGTPYSNCVTAVAKLHKTSAS
jgi:hypothetical protein